MSVRINRSIAWSGTKIQLWRWGLYLADEGAYLFFYYQFFSQGTRNCEMCYAELLNVDPMLLQLDLAAVQSSVHQPLRFVLKLISMIVLKFKPNVNAHILF